MRHRLGSRRPPWRACPVQQPRCPDGPPCSYPAPAAARRNCRHKDRQGSPAYAASHICHDHARRGGWTCATSRSLLAMPTRAAPCVATEPGRTSTATQTTSSPPTWPPAPDRGSLRLPRPKRETPGIVLWVYLVNGVSESSGMGEPVWLPSCYWTMSRLERMSATSGWWGPYAACLMASARSALARAAGSSPSCRWTVPRLERMSATSMWSGP